MGSAICDDIDHCTQYITHITCVFNVCPTTISDRSNWASAAFSEGWFNAIRRRLFDYSKDIWFGYLLKVLLCEEMLFITLGGIARRASEYNSAGIGVTLVKGEIPTPCILTKKRTGR